MPINTREALSYFKDNDPVMYGLLLTLTKSPTFTLPKARSSDEYFTSIVNSIISQQISVRAAHSIRSRVYDYLGEVTPKSVMKANMNKLKACGLSAQKTKYIAHNAEIWHTIPTNDFFSMGDEEIISELTKLYGIGRWTAEMFLMTSMARPDVFSYGDLGLMQGLYQSYNYKPHYKRKIRDTVDNWSPHRTLASFSLWHAKDNNPAL